MNHPPPPDLLSTAYPPFLETYWLDQAQRETHSVSDRDAIRRLIPDIRRLADHFTTLRPAHPAPPPPETPAPADAPAAPTAPATPSPYIRTTRHAIAYSLYFAPLTHARVNLLLPELPIRPPDPVRPYRILDLGAGTGAASWPALANARAHGHENISLDVADTSRSALRALHDLFIALRPAAFPSALLRTHLGPVQALDLPPAAFDLVLVHYLLNELPPDEQLQLLDKATALLAPDGILLICEPLVRADGDRHRAWREHALRDLRLNILAPCPHALACPLREPCHAVRTFPLVRSLQILNSALRRDLRHLAFTSLALTRAPLPPPTLGAPIPARIVAPPTFAKGQTLCPACLPDGTFARLQILHRDLPPATRKSLRFLERGQLLPLASCTPIGTPPLARARLALP